MTKKMITVPVGATVEIYKHTPLNFGRIRYNRKETVDIKYSSLDDAIKELQRIRKEYKDEYSDMSFDTIQDCGCYGDCSCSSTMFVTGKRLETDDEYEFRLAEEARHKEAQDERDQADFERLKEKLGKK